MTEKQDARAYARQIFERVADALSDVDDAGLFLAKVVAELFELSPTVREHVSDLLLTDLSEELHRRGGPGRDAARMVSEVQRDWTREG